MEMSADNTILYLKGFSPLIQLWAGICLLFFYESLLQKSPFIVLSDEIKKLYNDFKNQYNGLLPTEVINAEEYVKDHWNNNFVPTIKCVASICFFYSAFILAFTGIEGYPSYEGEHYCALQIMNTIVWIYLICAILFYRSRIFHGFTASIILSIILLIYFHIHSTINNICLPYICFGKTWSKSCITIYTVFTCIGGIILICFRLSLSWLILQCQKISVNNINKEFRIFVDYYLGKIHRGDLPEKKLGNIMKRCNDKFKRGEISSIDHDAFLIEMKKEVEKEYNEFTNKWWIKFF